MRQVKGEYVPSATPGTLTVSNVALGTVLPGARYAKYEGELAPSTHADPFRLRHEDPALKPT